MPADTTKDVTPRIRFVAYRSCRDRRRSSPRQHRPIARNTDCLSARSSTTARTCGAWVLSMQASQRRCTRSRASSLLTSLARTRGRGGPCYRVRLRSFPLRRPHRNGGRARCDGSACERGTNGRKSAANRCIPARGASESLPVGVERCPRIAPFSRRHQARCLQCMQQRLLAFRPPIHACGRPSGRVCRAL